ncbi:hypothetical protein [Leucobacter salsicius]|uniref:hypothetical protein n=1 Tax=Leucobacter salsicius TaxID=664638 RepID=UPI0003487D4D|nr:hypothetical protein [Leucobacter salsicius]
MSSKPARRLLAAAAIAGATFLLAGCSTGDAAPPTGSPDTPVEQTDDGVTRQAAHPDSIRQYAETLYPGVEGTIYVPTEADYDRLEAALADKLGCGEVVSWDGDLQCPDGSENEHAKRYTVSPTDTANLGHEYDKGGFVIFAGGYELTGENGDPVSGAGGLYDPETGALKSLN